MRSRVHAWRRVNARRRHRDPTGASSPAVAPVVRLVVSDSDPRSRAGQKMPASDTERRYRREARYSKQLRVTVQPATAAALEAEADAAGVSVSAVIRDAVARGLPLVKDARRG